MAESRKEQEKEQNSVTRTLVTGRRLQKKRCDQRDFR